LSYSIPAVAAAVFVAITTSILAVAFGNPYGENPILYGVKIGGGLGLFFGSLFNYLEGTDIGEWSYLAGRQKKFHHKHVENILKYSERFLAQLQ
jgi:hypothetical protein